MTFPSRMGDNIQMTARAERLKKKCEMRGVNLKNRGPYYDLATQKRPIRVLVAEILKKKSFIKY